MKISKYTNLVTVTNDLKLAYNANTDKFVAIKGNVHNIGMQDLLWVLISQ